MSELRLDRLEKLIAERGFSTTSLAEATGLGYHYIYRLRKGQWSDISSANLAAIAEALGTNTEYLLGRIDDPRPIDAMDDEDVIAYFEVSNPELAAVYKMILNLPEGLQDEAIQRLEDDVAMFQRLAESEERAREPEEEENAEEETKKA
jgi:transcriptional regulator with XRE-family HTH domain